MLRISFGWTTWFFSRLLNWLRSLFRSLLFRGWRLLRFLITKLIRFESWDIISLFGKDSNWFSNSKHALVVYNFCDISFIGRFEGNSCLISFDLANCISNVDLISFFYTPFHNFTFSHSWWQCWHLNKWRMLHEELDAWVIRQKRRYYY